MESKILHRKLFTRTTWILIECGSDEADGSFTFSGFLGSHTHLPHVLNLSHHGCTWLSQKVSRKTF